MDRRSEEPTTGSDEQLTSLDHHNSQVSLDRSVIETASLMSLDQIGVGGDASTLLTSETSKPVTMMTAASGGASANGGGHPSLALNEKVASLASSIYTELEKIVKLYGRDTVKELMSIVVNVLEALDSSIQEKEELLAENELMRDDYEKLLMQYEREKQSRKETESKLFQSEDLVEAQKNKYEERLKEMQMLVTTIDLKARNTSDQLARLEEKENECKKEYNKLHERYTELFKTHWDHLDRTKILFGHENATSVSRSGAKSNMSNNNNNSIINNSAVVSSNTSGGNVLSSSNVITSSGQLNDSSRHLFDMIKTSGAGVINRDELINALRACSKSDLHSVVGLLSQDTSDSDQTLETNRQSNTSTSSLVESSSKQSTSNEAQQQQQQADEAKLIIGDSLPNESALSRAETAAVDKLDNSDNFDEQLNNNGAGEFEEDDDEEEDDVASDMGGHNKNHSEIEFDPDDNMNIGQNMSLYKQMDTRGEIIDDADDGADLTVKKSFFGMSREVANLIRENSELMQTKHALNVVKDDLIVKLDQFSNEMVILKAEIHSLQTVKTALQQRITQLEEEARVSKEELAVKTRKIEEEDETVPMSQRKRFTRAEMARVIMERNQYKERLIDLQDAVRWTEMIRANKASEQQQQPTGGAATGSTDNSATGTSSSEASKKEEHDHKKRSTVWKFFSDLFSSQSQHQSTTAAAATTTSSLSPSSTYNNLSPKSNKRGQQSKVTTMSPSSSMGSPVQVVPGGGVSGGGLADVLSSDRSEKISKAYEFLKEDKNKVSGSVATAAASPAKNSTEVTVGGTLASSIHRVDEGRVQAYGWSLPSQSGKAKTGTADTGSLNLSVPVPVFCRPLFEEDNCLKMSCATSVNYEFDAQVTADCARFIQSSVYNSFQSNEDDDHQSIKSSCVWVCSFDENDTHVSVFDANKPDNLLSQFTLKSLKIHCSLGVPGANKSQLPLDDQRPSVSQRKPLNNETIKAGDQSGYPEDLDSITYIECEANDEEKPLHDLLVESKTTSNVKPNGEPVLSTAYPTVWLGSQEGLLLVHSSISNVNVTLDKIKLKDAILCISHNNGKVIVGLADGSVAIFYRSKSGQWDLKNYYLISFDNLHHSIRCLNNVYEHVWCGCRNKIYIVDPSELNVPAVIEVHPKKENQVRHMAWINDGVWVSIRLDTTLRLYHAKTRQHLQYLDIEPFITRMLGTSNLGLSLVRISSLMIASKRLWIGTGNGVVLSIPFTGDSSGRKSSLTGASLPGSVIRVSKSEEPLSVQDAKIPLCQLTDAQFSFHGHRDAVKFFLNVPTMTLSRALPGQKHERAETTLVISGGHGYIDFRIGDANSNTTAGRSGASLERKLHELSNKGEQQHQQTQPTDALVNKNDQSRLIVWEIKDHL